jgi:radical SAM superfamily enzyme YgiQ (UPF0313 family)
LATRLSATELEALIYFRRPRSWAPLEQSHRPEIDSLVRRQLLLPATEPHPDPEIRRRAWRRHPKGAVEIIIEARQPNQPQKLKVFGVQATAEIPLALGLLLGVIRAAPEIGDSIDGQLLREPRPSDVKHLAATSPGSVWLFSNYQWTVTANKVLAAAVRQADPEALIVAGGPHTPGYEPDLVNFFATNVTHDVLVHGEGEATIVDLVEAFLRGGKDELAGRPPGGCSVRVGSSYVRGPKRDRIADLDSLPSPYRSGFFDIYPAGSFSLAIIETNRGCPYGCTFCDWGSATRSRIRSFSLERVVEEIEWVAAHEVPYLAFADANFGILDRDREIAEAIVSAYQRRGYPKYFVTNWAKNPNRNVADIVDLLVKAGLATYGQVSLQTVDEATLAIANRRNISTDSYRDLTELFAAKGLPIVSDLMIGLPGSTVQSFLNDLQYVIETDVHVNCYRTMLLPNNPMNAPAFLADQQIVVDSHDFVVSTKSFTAADLKEMLTIQAAFRAAYDLGTARIWLRFVADSLEMSEIEVLQVAMAQVSADPTPFPIVKWVWETLGRWAVVPIDWRLYMSELRALAEVLGVPNDSALLAVIEAQYVLLPRWGTDYPAAIEVSHDVVAWWHQEVGAGTPQRQRQRLQDFPPSSLSVDDPNRIGSSGMGRLSTNGLAGRWDLEGPISRNIARTTELV